jgi:hypothetical protein
MSCTDERRHPSSARSAPEVNFRSGICDFYRRSIPEEVTRATWARILASDQRLPCRLAEVGDNIVGFVDFIVHPITWSTHDARYLEDLFVVPAARPRRRRCDDRVPPGAREGRAVVAALLDDRSR